MRNTRDRQQATGSGRGRVEARASAAAEYDRRRDLPRLLNLWPAEVARLGPADQAVIVQRLMQALRAERKRGRCGHWTYDLLRHARLTAAYRSERQGLAGLQRQRMASGGRKATATSAPSAHPTPSP